MKVTLRKANALQNTIVDALDKLNFDPEIRINEFQDPEKEIFAAYEAFINEGDRRDALLDALYSIRKQVARANVEAGVSDLLADIARVEKDVRFYNFVDRVKPRMQGDVLKGKLEKLSEKTETRSIYGREDSVVTTIFASEDLAVLVQSQKDAKKEKQRLQDALLEANIRNEIELDAQTEQTLRDENLI